MSPLWLRLFLPTLLGGTLFAGALTLYGHELSQAEKLWQLSMHRQTEAVVDRFHDNFRSVYEGLRTIARLPGVRNHEPGDSGAPLDSDTLAVAQEVYNNLATSFSISEVYIVPDDSDHQQAADTTWQPTPAAKFHALELDSTLTQVRHSPNPETNRTALDEQAERGIIGQQLDRMRREFPTDDSFDGLDHPALSSAEIHTAGSGLTDGQNGEPLDRRGILYSVPYYGPDGALRGSVSAVVAVPHRESSSGDDARPHRACRSGPPASAAPQ